MRAVDSITDSGSPTLNDVLFLNNAASVDGGLSTSVDRLSSTQVTFIGNYRGSVRRGGLHEHWLASLQERPLPGQSKCQCRRGTPQLFTEIPPWSMSHYLPTRLSMDQFSTTAMETQALRTASSGTTVPQRSSTILGGTATFFQLHSSKCPEGV